MTKARSVWEQAPKKCAVMVIKLLSFCSVFFFANPKSEVADLCKSTSVNVCQIIGMNERYLLFNTITHLPSPVILRYIEVVQHHLRFMGPKSRLLYVIMYFIMCKYSKRKNCKG